MRCQYKYTLLINRVQIRKLYVFIVIIGDINIFLVINYFCKYYTGNTFLNKSMTYDVFFKLDL